MVNLLILRARSTAFVTLSLALSLFISPWCLADDFSEFNPPPEVSGDRVLAIVGARLIDGKGGEPVENATILVRGSKIEAAGPVDSVNVPAGAVRVDLSGMTVVPGFVDCHFHSVNNLATPLAFLVKGVTTFRDPGHPFRFYQAVQQSSKPMPRVFLTGSHLDAYPPIWPRQATIVGNKEQTRKAVEENVDRGATAIKLYFRLPLELVQTACEAAHLRGVPVTAHLELVRATEAIDAGLDGVEHVTSFGTSLSSEAAAERFIKIVRDLPSTRDEWRYRLWADLDLEGSKRLGPLLKQIVDQKVVVSPTLAVYERRVDFEDAKDFEVVGFQKMLEFVGHCHQAGATLVAGSHTWVPGAEFGLAFQRELELLVESGLTPLEAITAGTLSGAKFLRTERRLGSIEAGKLADLVVVEGNPADDITQLRAVRRVMLNGRWIANQ